MRVRRRGARLAAALALTAGAALAVPGPASASPPPSDDDQASEYLKPTLSDPILGEGNQLIYQATLTNNGPVTATGVRMLRTAFLCPPDKPVTNLDDCTPLYSEEKTLPDIKSGDTATYPVNIQLPGPRATQVRTTIEVTHVNEWDIGHAYPGCTWFDQKWTGCAEKITPLTG